MSEKIVRRSDKVAFMNTGTAENPVYSRMRKFTEMSNSKNPTEYSRTYVDEDGEVTDVTGYSPEIGYAFDQYTDNAVHAKIATIADDELKGADALVEILVVDKTTANESGVCEARKRKYAVVPDTDGDSTDAYTYSGTLRSNGTYEKVDATISTDGLTATIEVEPSV